MRRRIALSCALVLALGPALGAAPPDGARDPDVERGIRQVEEGEHGAAIVTLDAAVRKLAGAGAGHAALAEVYLYLGVAYLSTGQESRARARLRDALRHRPDLELAPGRFPPRVRDFFLAVKEDAGAAPSARPGRASRLPLVLGGAALVATGVALAVGGGGDTSPDGDALEQTFFLNEVVAPRSERHHVVTPTAAGPLTAILSWQQSGVALGVTIATLQNTAQILATGTPIGATELQLDVPVTAQGYRVTVTHDAQGPPVVATYSLRVRHP